MSHARCCYLATLAVVSLAGQATTAHAQFTININFTGGLTPSQQNVFATAASFWQSHITGYRPAGVTLTGITIDASGQAIDGVGGILGSAGPNNIQRQQNVWYTSTGVMQFDSADLSNMEANGTLQTVIMHEMAHVIGFGTLWTQNGLYSNGTGQYTGASALATYKLEFNQPNAASVPVELGGGSGTADGHWNEVNGGSGLTGIVDQQGRDMRNELMTGWLNSPAFVSNTTIQQFFDLGYNVVPVPEPASVLAVAVGGLLVARRVRSRLRKPTAVA